ncbi:MAG: WD40 repeat domain-containing protein [Pleurocapsa minor GSE-CHR-MK-17-07R]|jgi:WD40 repeat protein|nr:WD40 repeat domain-containing protein [Pleurocapsa minor GSE-CHR-MK 17-07R]
MIRDQMAVSAGAVLLCCSILAPAHSQPQEPLLTYGRGTPKQVQWEPSSQSVLVVTHDNMLWQYNIATFEVITTRLDVSEVQYSPDGTLLLTRTEDGAWVLRSSASLDVVLSERFSQVFFSSDGAWLVTSTADGSSDLRATANPEIVVLSDFSAIVFSPDGAWLVTSTADGSSDLRATANPEVVVLSDFSAIVFSPDAQFMVTQEDDGEYMLRRRDAAPLHALPRPESDITGIVWLPDSSAVAMLGSADEILIYDIATRQTRAFVTPDRARYNSLYWSPDARLFFDQDYAGSFRVWDVSDGRMIAEIPSEEPYLPPEERLQGVSAYYPIWFLSWSTDGSHVFRCKSYGDLGLICSAYDALTGIPGAQFSGDSLWQRTAFDFTPDRRYLALSRGLFDANTGAVVADFSETNQDGTFRAWSSNNRFMATASIFSQQIALFDLQSMQPHAVLNETPFRYALDSLAWSPDSRYVLAWGGRATNESIPSGLITIWDAETGAELGSITDHIVFGHQIAFSSDDSYVAATDALGRIAIFDTASGDMMHMLSGASERITTMQWQPGGHLLAAATGRVSGIGYPHTVPVDGTLVRIWDTRTGNVVALLEHDIRVRALAWNPAGTLLATDDEELHVWSVASWAELPVPQIIASPPYPVTLEWVMEGQFISRAQNNCSHSPGPSIFLYNVESGASIGPIVCIDQPPIWIPEINTTLASGRLCEDSGCTLAVSAISPEVDPGYTGDSLFGFPVTYTFGAYGQRPELLRSPDGQSLLALSEGAADMWLLGLENASLQWTTENVVSVALSSDGRRIVLAYGDGRVTIADSTTGDILFALPDSDVLQMLWRGDGAYLALLQRDAVVVIDASSGAEQLRVPLEETANASIAWQNRYLFVCTDLPCQPVLRDVETGHVVLAADQLPATLSHDGRLAAELNGSIFRVWRLTGAQP